MNILIGIFIVNLVNFGPISASSQDVQLGEFFDGIVNETINNFLAKLSDPVEVGPQSLIFDSFFVSGKADFAGIQLHGVKKLIATKINYRMMQNILNLTVVLPELSIFSKYTADLLLATQLPFFGDGNVSLAVNNIELLINATVKINITALAVTNVSDIGVAFSLSDDANIDLQGLLDNEEFSDVATETLQYMLSKIIKYLDEHEVAVGEIISPIIQKILDNIFNNSSLEKMLSEVKEIVCDEGFYGDIEESILIPFYNQLR